MSQWNARKVLPQDINGGFEFNPNDGLRDSDINTIANGILYANESLDNIVDGSPRGVYASLSALQTAYPTGAVGVYVCSDNGHWYYWNGTTWADGGVYQCSEDINAIKETLDDIVPTTTEVKIDDINRNYTPMTVLEDHYVSADGSFAQSNTYWTFYFKVENDGVFYFDDDSSNSSVVLCAIYSGEPSANTFKIRYRNIDNNIPKENTYVNVNNGDYIAISLYLNVGVSQLYFNAYLKYDIYTNDTFGAIKLNSNQIVQTNVKNRIHIKYINGNGLDNSTEKVEIYIPTLVGFIRYDFLHCISLNKNSNVWRVGYAYACDDNFTQRYSITVFGEWECAIHLDNDGDYTGGIVHGNELTDDIVFFVDGGKVDITEYVEATPINNLVIAKSSKMYNSTDSSDLIATHGTEHTFSIDGLKIGQSLKWNKSVNVTWCYMAMHLPSKTYTDKFYKDNDITPSNITYGLFDNVKRVVLYGENTGVKTEFTIEDYPSGLNGGDKLLTGDNGGNPYNKCYFVVCSSGSIASDTIWKSTTKYKFDVNS